MKVKINQIVKAMLAVAFAVVMYSNTIKIER
jgi:hypothetical protein